MIVMNRLCRVGSIALGVAACSSALASGWIVPASNGKAALVQQSAEPFARALVSNAARLSVRVATPGVYVKEAKLKGGFFTRLELPGAVNDGVIGQPSLPVVRRLFVAPVGASVNWTVSTGAAFSVALGDAGVPGLIAPQQAPVVKQPGALEAAPFAFDEAFYGAGKTSPSEMVRVEEVGMMRGQRVMLLEVRPVAYDAKAKSVQLFPNIDVDIKFTGGAWSQEANDALRRVAINGDQIASLGTKQSGAGRLLIVVPPGAYASMVQPFVNAKTSQGYTVSVYTTPVGVTAAQLKTTIKSQYDVASTRPDYLLLVGDTNTIPNFTSSMTDNPASDLSYVCMDAGDDWLPDIAVGRWSFRTDAQLQAQIDKTLSFEAGQFSDPSYTYRAVFMASTDNHSITEATHNWTIDTYMTPNGITSDKLYVYTNSATTQQTRNALNAGRYYAIYSGHGAESYWADGPVFTQADVNGLTNNQQFAMVASFACLTGRYEYDECFAETWLRAANKGAVTMLASSVTSYWTEDDVLQKRLFDTIYDTTDGTPSEMGPAIMESKLRYIASMGSNTTTHRYFDMYNLFGDPTLAITAAPVGPRIRVAPSSVEVPEGGTAQFSVWLDTAPASPVTLTVERLSGDTDISVSGSVTLGFTPQNYATPQTVTLAAAQDSDNVRGVATIRVSAPDWVSGIVSATEIDDEPYGDVYEPDNTVATAKLIASGANQTRSIDPAGDVDYVKFNATSGKVYVIGTTGSEDMYLHLYGTDGTTQIASDDDSGVDTNPELTWTCPATGTYYAKLRHYYADRTCDYALYMSEQSSTGDAYEPDNAYASAQWILVNGVKQNHTFQPAGDVDYVRFQALGGVQYSIETFGSIDTYLHLYGTDGTTQIAYDDDAGAGTCSLITWTAPASGTYYVKARHYNTTGTGAYQLSVTGPSAVVTGTIALQGALAAGKQATIETLQSCCTGPAETHVVTLGAGGAFSFTSNVVGLVEFRVRVDGYLARRATPFELRPAGGSFSATLSCGDLDGDNDVDIDDYDVLASAYGTFAGDSGYSAIADLDNDGDVDIDDYDLLAANYGSFGQ